MMKLLRNLKVDKSGASAAEYALIIAAMGAAVIAGVSLLAPAVQTSFTNTATNIGNAGTP